MRVFRHSGLGQRRRQLGDRCRTYRARRPILLSREFLTFTLYAGLLILSLTLIAMTLRTMT